MRGVDKDTHTSELILAGVAQLLGGEIYVAPGHREGTAFLNLIPNPKDAGKLLGTGTGLPWHTEDAQFGNNADQDSERHIVLFGLRGDPNAATLITTINPCALDPDLLAEITTKRFEVHADGLYAEAYSEDATMVDLRPDGGFRLRFDAALSTGQDGQELAAEDKDLFTAVEDQFNQHHRRFVIGGVTCWFSAITSLLMPLPGIGQDPSSPQTSGSSNG